MPSWARGTGVLDWNRVCDCDCVRVLIEVMRQLLGNVCGVYRDRDRVRMWLIDKGNWFKDDDDLSQDV